jgi:glyoxylase-like metal-dependent hydrolase (beta-lactamase superfamily II)
MPRSPFVHQFRLGPWGNFVYFLGDAETRQVAVVDPAWHAKSIVEEAARLDVHITHVLCTHSHFDHVNQVDELLKTHDVPVHMLGAEVEFSGFRSENLAVSRPGDTLGIGAHLELTMVHTPGHTPGSVSYLTDIGLVTGDTLFINGCGRCDFVGGDPEVMYETLKRITDSLPGATVLYPGHDYGPTKSATVDEQLEQNPYLAHETLESFVKHRMEGKTPGSSLPTPPAWTPEAQPE